MVPKLRALRDEVLPFQIAAEIEVQRRIMVKCQPSCLAVNWLLVG